MNVKKILIIGLVLVFLFLTACESDDVKTPVYLSSPFIGGSQGLKTEFIGLRTEVFDLADPFDVTVKLENMGEAPISKNDVEITLSGINPLEFGKSAQNFKKAGISDDLIEVRKATTGERIPSQAIEETFENLQYAGVLKGDVKFTLRADTCYNYKTEAISKLCVRRNLLNPVKGGICEINENKPIYSSSAPVQIAQFSQSARSSDKVAFSVTINNRGAGSLFKANSKCDTAHRANLDKVYLTIKTGLDGLTCTGLTSTGTSVSGEVTLYDGVRTVTCSQIISHRADYEQIVEITTEYAYLDVIQTHFTVKSSGETLTT